MISAMVQKHLIMNMIPQKAAQYGNYGGSPSLYCPSNCNLVLGELTDDFELEFDYYPTSDHVWKE